MRFRAVIRYGYLDKLDLLRRADGLFGLLWHEELP